MQKKIVLCLVALLVFVGNVSFLHATSCELQGTCQPGVKNFIIDKPDADICNPQDPNANAQCKDICKTTLDTLCSNLLCGGTATCESGSPHTQCHCLFSCNEPAGPQL
jgi:hypothetical protein